MPRRILLLYALVIVIAIDLSFGSNGFLFPVLREVAPPYRGLRVPARAIAFVFLVLGVAASFAATRLLEHLRLRSAGIVLLVLLSGLTAEFRLRPNLWSPRLSETAILWVPPPGSVLVEYPLADPGALGDNRDAYYMAARIGDWPNLLNGYSGNFPQSYFDLLVAARHFPRDEVLADFVRRGATHLVVHEAGMQGRYTPTLEELLAKPQLTIVGRYREADGEVVVFRLGFPRG
jgi:hypothetical protein